MSITNFSKNYQALRNITLGTLALLILSHILWTLIYIHTIYQNQAQVYIVTDQGTFIGNHQPNSQRDPVEAIDHIQKFTHYMFTHDKNTYEKHLDQALHLINQQEGLIIQQGFERDKLLDLYIRQGARWESHIDTIIIDPGTHPISGKVYWQQQTLVGENSQQLPAAARFQLSPWPRSRDNPNGLLINHWEYIPYQQRE